jgi:O-antigen/teichoic acid export membrane protein
MSDPTPRGPRWLQRRRLTRTLIANCTARVLAIVGVSLASVLVARVGGPEAVGTYALLRILPGLLGVLCVLGLPGSMTYFLGPAYRDDPRLWPTIAAILAGGSALGLCAWLTLAHTLQRTFFDGDSTKVIAVGAAAVVTQLSLTVSKTALQGLGDRRGGDAVIAAEELAFLPAYALVLAAGVDGTLAMLAGLVLADIVVAADGWRRVAHNLGWRRLGLAPAPLGWWGRPRARLATEITVFGSKGQLGGMIALLNLRLDFAILGALAGPAVLGTYAVASKYAEMLRLPGTALTWVTYPEFAGMSPGAALTRARRLVSPSLLWVTVAAGPLLLLAAPVIRLLYGSDFHDAVEPAHILLLGMVLGGTAGVASGFLYGRGRPGLNSLALGLGLVVTTVLDVLLIPRFGAVGAAYASMIAYLVSDGALTLMLLRHRSGPSPLSADAARVSPAVSR